MAAIIGLTEAQNAALEGATIGDLILVQRVPVVRHEDFDQDANHDTDDENAYGVGEEQWIRDEDGEDDPEDSNDPAEPRSDDSGTSQNATAPTSSTANPPPAVMYLISQLMKDEATGTTTDLGLAPLAFRDKISADSSHSYHIQGDTCIVYHSCDSTCEAVTVTAIATADSSFLLSPGGDAARNVVHSLTRCIDECKGGFLDSASCLRDMVKDYIPETMEYEQNVGPLPALLQKPLCPICIGPGLLRQQQALQHSLLTTSTVDFTQLHQYHSTLSARRHALRATIGGYHYIQFDERQWGMAFDDMLSNEESDDGGDNTQFEHWTEANDPNGNVQLRPASDETIAALIRKTRAEIILDGDDELCCIDREAFDADSMLVQLPCGHAKFHEECIVTWLKQFDNCPICRQAVPDVNGEQKDKQQKPDYPVAALSMSLAEALKSLGYGEGQSFESVDQEMLPFIFDNARQGRPGWRTDTAIARIQFEMSRQAADGKPDGSVLDGETPSGDEDMDPDDEHAGWEGDASMSDE